MKCRRSEASVHKTRSFTQGGAFPQRRDSLRPGLGLFRPVGALKLGLVRNLARPRAFNGLRSTRSQARLPFGSADRREFLQFVEAAVPAVVVAVAHLRIREAVVGNLHFGETVPVEEVHVTSVSPNSTCGLPYQFQV